MEVKPPAANRVSSQDDPVNSLLVEQPGFEPGSAGKAPSPIRPSPVHGSAAAVLLGQLGHPTGRLSRLSTVFPVVGLLSGCHPPLLLPGCGELAPCAITGHDFSLPSE